MNSHSILTKETVINFICSGIAGFIARAIDYPFGVLVGRLIDHPEKIRSLQQLKIAALAESYNKSYSEQLLDFYRGFGMGEVRRVASRTFTYGFQPLTVNYISSFKLNEDAAPVTSVMIEAAAGGVTSLVKTALFYPLDTLKVRRQNGNQKPLKHIVQQEKFNLYQGLHLALLNKTLGSSILFGVNAAVLLLLGASNEKNATWLQIAIASNLAAASEALIINPLSVVQGRLQESEHPIKISPISMFNTIVKEEGVSALYKGAVVSVITSFPKKALPLAISGWGMLLWNNHNADKQQIIHQNYKRHVGE